jgi:hypothetical protein
MALGLIMKYNDRTVIRMRAENGGIFERQSPPSSPHQTLTAIQPKCA